ncbi:MAG TPA: SBBP repeat-containing protein [Tepidisphaeraceae bacterium]|jgi:hypothetical protein
MPTDRRVLTETLEARRLCAANYPFAFGGGGFDNAQETVQTRQGDVIVTGQFSGTTNFARPGQRAAVLTARGDTDLFVASYAARGTLNWAIRMGGDYHSDVMDDFSKRDVQLSQNRFSRYVGRIGGQARGAGEYVNDLAVDTSGNIYLAGSFRESFKAGRFNLTADQTFTSSFQDAVVMKIDTTGVVTWAQRFGGAFDDAALSLGLDAAGTPTIGGYYSREADFDPGRARQTLRTEGRDAGFVLRLSPVNGSFSWVYQFESDAIGTDERNAVNDLVVTRRGEVYFAGSYASDADFLPGRSEYVLESRGKTDAFVAKLSRKGALVWAQSTGGGEYDANSSIALAADGSVYTAGYFSDEADVDPRAGVETIYEAVSDGDRDSEFSDLLVTKLTADGTPVWINQIGGEYIETIADLTVDRAGDIYVTGSFFNQIDLAPGRPRFLLESTRVNGESIKDNNTRFGRNESYDWFVSKLSPRGKFVAGAKFGGADDDYSSSLTPLFDGTLLLSGRAVNARPRDRDDRQEQALIQLLAPDLSIL